MATVYQFETWDIRSDEFTRSRRWATKEAIERVGGRIVSEGAEVDDQHLGREVDGMTPRGFDPRHPPRRDFG